MNEYSIIVNFGKGKIVTDLSKLVKNDYNSTKFNFTFDKEGISYLFKLLYPDNTYWVKEIVDNSVTLEKGVLNQKGSYKFEISVYGQDKKLTDTAIHEFFVREDLVNTDEEVAVDDRIPILDDIINKDNQRTLNENIRISNEEARTSNEETRIENEKTRLENEKTRVSNEEIRIENEGSRLTSENQREENETIRKSNESNRLSNEETRILNENGRISNENQREEYINQFKKDVEDGKFDGECNFATFSINIGTGRLEMNKTDNLLLDFAIENGMLEVII